MKTFQMRRLCLITLMLLYVLLWSTWIEHGASAQRRRVAGLNADLPTFCGHTTITSPDELAKDQDRPALAADAQGNLYAIWYDKRNGHWDIYFAYRPSGGTWGANEQVNDDVGTTDQFSPSIAVDGSGNAYAVWVDERNGDRDIYFAYRPAGGAWGTNVRVNDTAGTAEYTPAIAVDPDGNAYAVWTDSRNGNLDTYFAYRPAGGTWGTNSRVNDDPGETDQELPIIAVDASGNAYAIWLDRRHERTNPDIYFAYRPARGVWGANTMVNDSPGKVSPGFVPSIAVDDRGNAYAVWEDEREGNSDIYLAFRLAGYDWSRNILVNDEPSDWHPAYQCNPAVAIDANGGIYAIWEDSRNSPKGDIYFSQSWGPYSWQRSIRINDDSGGAEHWNPIIAADPVGNVYALWVDQRTGNPEIYFAERPAGGTWGTNIKINDDVGTAWQRYPAVAVDADGQAYAAWVDWRNATGKPDIYFAQYPTGGGWGTNTRINDAIGSAHEGFPPAFGVDANGNAYAAWVDNRNGNPDIYFAHRPAGGIWGANVRVNDDAGTAQQLSPSIAVDARGNTWAIWVDNRDGLDIYSSYRPAGGMWSANVKINDDDGSAQKSSPAIAMDANGNAYAVWIDDRDGHDSIYFAYRPVSGSWGTNTRVSGSTATAWQNNPSIAADASGNAYCVWQEGDVGVVEILFAYRPSQGTWGASVKVNDDVGIAWQDSPDIAVDTRGNAYAVWRDDRNGYGGNIYFAYRPSGGNWGSNIRVSGNTASGWQDNPAISVDADGNAYVLWDDNLWGSSIAFAHTRCGVTPTPSATLSPTLTATPMRASLYLPLILLSR